MKYIFTLKGLDCPHCSAKIEQKVSEMPGITKSTVNLMKQTLTVESKKNDAILTEITDLVHTYEPDVKVSFYKKDLSEKIKTNNRELVKIIIGGIFYLLGLILMKLPAISNIFGFTAFIVAYLILGGEVIKKAVKNILKGDIFDENFLMLISSIGAVCLKMYSEAVAIMLFYAIGEYFENVAVCKSRQSIANLMNIRPDSANVERGGKVIKESPESVNIGEIILVKPGEKIPLDGVVISGNSELNTSALTGESVPREVSENSEVMSGCVNISGVLKIKVVKEFSESTASKIIDMVENAASEKAPSESFISTFAKYYTPIIVALAVLLAIIPPFVLGGGFGKWIGRSLIFLVISCPCALVISVPLTFYGGIGTASKKGVLVKGGNYLEALSNVNTVVLDKTGTLTEGKFQVCEINSTAEFTDDEVLKFAAIAENFSNHPIAKGIIEAYGKPIDNSSTENYKEIAGKGITVTVEGKNIAVGNLKLMKDLGVQTCKSKAKGTGVFVAADGKFAGEIVLEDKIKCGALNFSKELKRVGINKTVMLTGDNGEIAKNVCEKLQIDEYYAELLPNEKVEFFRNIKKKTQKGKVVFVGDGINDAPVLAMADIGVAMGGVGSDAAVEASDAVIMTDDPSKLIDAIKLAKSTKRIVVENIVFALGVKGLFMILGAFGIANMWEAVFGDVGVMIIAVLNSMRIMKK